MIGKRIFKVFKFIKFKCVILIIDFKNFFFDKKLLKGGILVIFNVVIIVSVNEIGMIVSKLFNFLILCVLVEWLILFVIINSVFLNVVWLIKWNMVVINLVI